MQAQHYKALERARRALDAALTKSLAEPCDEAVQLIQDAARATSTIIGSALRAEEETGVTSGW